MTDKNKKLLFRFSIFGVVLILIIISVSFFSSRLNTPPTYSGGKSVGKLAPNVTLTTLDGDEVKLRELTGKRVIVNFFNSWCVPCQEELPDLQAFEKKHGSDPDFVFLGIVRDDSESNIRKWATKNNEPFQILLDPDQEASIGFGTTGQPETYAIAPNGRVVGSLLARASSESLEQLWAATQ